MGNDAIQEKKFLQLFHSTQEENVALAFLTIFAFFCPNGVGNF